MLMCAVSMRFEDFSVLEAWLDIETSSLKLGLVW